MNSKVNILNKGLELNLRDVVVLESVQMQFFIFKYVCLNFFHEVGQAGSETNFFLLVPTGN